MEIDNQIFNNEEKKVNSYNLYSQIKTKLIVIKELIDITLLYNVDESTNKVFQTQGHWIVNEK